MVDFGRLKVELVVMHRVPAGPRRRSTESIEMSEAPLELEPRDQGFLELRLRRTLGGHSRDVVEDHDLGHPLPPKLRGLLVAGAMTDDDLVRESEQFADLIFEHQAANAPAGLVTMIKCSIDSEPVLVLAKLEHEEGLRVDVVQNAQGKRTFKATFLNDLVLGENTKIFKVAAFPKSLAGSRLAGHLVDSQQTGGGVASYFVSEVLGCQFALNSDVMTERFYEQSEQFFAAVPDLERRARYEIALLAEMQSAVPHLEPRLFAQRHIDSSDRDAYMSRLSLGGVSISRSNKNTSLISSKIKRLKIHTSRGADLLIPPPMWEDGAVEIDGTVDGATIIVRDQVQRMTGAGRSKAKADDH